MAEPIAEWTDDRLVEIRQRGISRHVVRFVAEGGEVYALKELDERLARREYRLLRELRRRSASRRSRCSGVVVDRPGDLDSVLVTRFLDHSISYRALFANPRGGQPTDKLLDAMVELLARLHLAGFMWGDCSLSNTLFRLDAGALAAYLVDAETSELHPIAVRRQALVRRRSRLRAGRRRAVRPAGRRAAAAGCGPDRGGRGDPPPVRRAVERS